jgi:hypothetical protein
MPHMTEVKCANAKCCKVFEARTADVNRGWGKFCSKSCKARRQGRLLASKETQKMWRDYNRGYDNQQAQEDEHQAILDDLGETADDKWGDSGLTSY